MTPGYGREVTGGATLNFDERFPAPREGLGMDSFQPNNLHLENEQFFPN
jgi:hypothetical protein